MRFQSIGIVVLAAELAVVGAPTIGAAEQADPGEVGRIKRTLEEQEETIEELRRRV